MRDPDRLRSASGRFEPTGAHSSSTAPALNSRYRSPAAREPITNRVVHSQTTSFTGPADAVIDFLPSRIYDELPGRRHAERARMTRRVGGADGSAPSIRRSTLISDHEHRSVELTGSSTNSVEGGVRAAVAKASEALRHLGWLEVPAIRGIVERGALRAFGSRSSSSSCSSMRVGNES